MRATIGEGRRKGGAEIEKRMLHYTNAAFVGVRYRTDPCSRDVGLRLAWFKMLRWGGQICEVGIVTHRWMRLNSTLPCIQCVCNLQG